MTRQTRIMTQTINLFHQADHVGPRVASSAAPETNRPMPSIGGARHYASSAAPAASRAAASRPRSIAGRRRPRAVPPGGPSPHL